MAATGRNTGMPSPPRSAATRAAAAAGRSSIAFVQAVGLEDTSVVALTAAGKTGTTGTAQPQEQDSISSRLAGARNPSGRRHRSSESKGDNLGSSGGNYVAS
jgi:hypothetical protein